MNKSRPMVESKSKPGSILKLALLQFIGTLFFSLVLYYCYDAREAISGLLGGTISAVSSLYMAGRLFASRKANDAPEMLVRFYSSVVLKALFTLSMMAICLIVIKVSVLPFIIGYLLAALIINLFFLLIEEA